MLQGRPVKALKRVASIRNTRDWEICGKHRSDPSPNRAMTAPDTLHRYGIPPSSRISCGKHHGN
ncbi:hypothetical protein JZ751_020393 [Albula glossodonta]|uniref:Uncharacterized protein n=1 Tax=Albula glossodonta TaxID=121402 RepID=A0A8T2MTQ3_9TELE|nr:hypothetical protein JZ751_020393 [Albula glossodonta]